MKIDTLERSIHLRKQNIYSIIIWEPGMVTHAGHSSAWEPDAGEWPVVSKKKKKKSKKKRGFNSM